MADGLNVGGLLSVPNIGTVVEVDSSRMSASAIISTPAVDRVGDSMDTLGCDLTQYRKNPVVFWNHAFDGFTRPIGISENPAGQLEVYPTSEHIKATCYFTNKFLEAEPLGLALFFEHACCRPLKPSPLQAKEPLGQIIPGRDRSADAPDDCPEGGPRSKVFEDLVPVDALVIEGNQGQFIDEGLTSLSNAFGS